MMLLDKIHNWGFCDWGPKQFYPMKEIWRRILRFTKWLDQYGEVSYDFQSIYASRLGQSAKALYYRKPLLGTLAVSPMVFCEAFVPSARRLFWKPQRFPIADAHYAMGFPLSLSGS